jgi:hypothetical protein
MMAETLASNVIEEVTQGERAAAGRSWQPPPWSMADTMHGGPASSFAAPAAPALVSAAAASWQLSSAYASCAVPTTAAASALVCGKTVLARGHEVSSTVQELLGRFERLNAQVRPPVRITAPPPLPLLTLSASQPASSDEHHRCCSHRSVRQAEAARRGELSALSALSAVLAERNVLAARSAALVSRAARHALWRPCARGGLYGRRTWLNGSEGGYVEKRPAQ